MRKLLCYFVVLVSIMTSCSSGDDSSKIEYLPFQSEQGGKWGLISTNGEILFKDEFENEPTVARNGRFMVKNKDEKYEIYTAEENPKKIGKEYVSAGSFIEEIAPVAEASGCVEFIDVDGNVKFKLDKVNGKPVTAVSNFSEGVARFYCNEDIGCIDKNGNVIIKPLYCAMTSCSDGKIIAIDKKYKGFEKKNQKDKVVVSVLDKTGKQLFSFNLNKYDDFEGFFTGGVMPVKDIDDNNKPQCGIIDAEGKWLLKPTKNISEIQKVQGENFVFSDGSSYGIKNIKGENIIKPKYDYLLFADKNLLFAGKKDGKNVNFKLINLEDKEIGSKIYEYALPFFDGNHAAVKTSKHSWTFINKEGKEIEKMPDIFRIDYNVGNYYVESDFVDLDALVEDLKITKDGLDVISLGTLPKSMLIKADANNDTTLMNYRYKWTQFIRKPSEYYGLNSIEYYKKIDNLECSFVAYWTGESGIVRPVTKYQTYDFWDYTYSIPYTAGYAFVSRGPSVISVSILDHKIDTKTKTLFDKLVAKIAKMGKEIKKTDYAAIYNVGNHPFIIYNDDANKIVRLTIGTRTDMKNIDISDYSGKSMKNSKNEQKKERKKSQEYNDSIMADTTIIDFRPYIDL